MGGFERRTQAGGQPAASTCAMMVLLGSHRRPSEPHQDGSYQVQHCIKCWTSSRFTSKIGGAGTRLPRQCLKSFSELLVNDLQFVSPNWPLSGRAVVICLELVTVMFPRA